MVLLLAFATLFGCLARWRKPLTGHARLLYWQHRCAIYSFAPDAVVASVGGKPRVVSAPVPACWSGYESMLPANAAGAWRGYSPMFQPTLAFLHRLRSPAGHAHVVAVRCVPLYLCSGSVRQAFCTAAVEPAAAWPLSSRPAMHGADCAGGFPVKVKVQVFGGQSDPADPSHFTIAYTVAGLPGTLDGWLRDDDTVELDVRPGSADVSDTWKAGTAKR